MNVMNRTKGKKRNGNRTLSNAVDRAIEGLELRILFSGPSIGAVAATYTTDSIAVTDTLTATTVSAGSGTLSSVTFYAEKTAGTQAPASDYKLGNGSVGATSTLYYNPTTSTNYDLPVGNYTIYAVATDTDSTTGNSPAASLSIVSGPAVSAINVASAVDQLSTSDKLSVTGVVPDLGDTIKTVNFYAEKGTTPSPSTDYSLGTGSLSGTTASLTYYPGAPTTGYAYLTPGTYTIYAQATSATGLTSNYPTTAQLTVYNAPSIGSLSLGTSTNPYNLADTITASNVFSEAASTTDPVTSVAFYAEKTSGTFAYGHGDISLGTVSANGGDPTSYTLNYTPTTALGIGANTIYAVATTQSGKTSITASTSVTGTGTTLAPATATLTIPANDGSGSGPAIGTVAITNANDPDNVSDTLVVQNVLADPGNPVTSVTFYAKTGSTSYSLGAASQGTGNNPSTNYYDTFTPASISPTVPAATYSVYAAVTTATGTVTSATTPFTIVSGAPVVNNITLSASSAGPGTVITLTAGVLSEPTDAVTSVEFYSTSTGGTIDLGPGTETNASTFVGSYTIPTTSTLPTGLIVVGSNTIYAIAKTVGNVSSTYATSATSGLTITEPIITALTPSVTTDAVNEADVLTATGVYATGTGAGDTIQNVKYYLENIPGTSSTTSDFYLGTGTVSTSSASTYTYSFTPNSIPLPVGTYTIYAVATTSGGKNITSPTTTISVVNQSIALAQTVYNTDAVPSGGENLAITVTRVGDLSQAVNVNYYTADGTTEVDSLVTPATAANNQYTPVPQSSPGTITFPAYNSQTGTAAQLAAATTQTITIHVVTPPLSQDVDSQFTVNLENAPTGYIINPLASAANILIDETPKPFNQNNSANDDVVVEQSGNNVSTASSNGNTTYLDEYSPTGALIQSFPLPDAQMLAQDALNGVSTNNLPLLVGTSGAEAFPTLSESGQYLVLAGTQTPTGNTHADLGLVGNTASGASLGVSGVSVNTSNSVNFGGSPIGTLRGVASENGSTIYFVANSQGLLQASGTGGANQSFQLVPAAGSKPNLRGAAVNAAGQPYITGSTAVNGTTLNFSPVLPGYSLPINSTTDDPGAVESLSSPYQFAFASEGALDDTVYIADNTGSPSSAIKKFSLVTPASANSANPVPVSDIAQYNAYLNNQTLPGVWIAEGSVAAPSGQEWEGLALDQISPTQVQIYGTCASQFQPAGTTYVNVSTLYSFTDTLSPSGPTALTATLNAPNATIPAAASTISEFHGAAIAPASLSAPNLTLAPGSANANATAGTVTASTGQTVTLSSYATGTPTPQVQWYEATGGSNTFYPVTSRGLTDSTTSGTFENYTFTASSSAKFEAVWYSVNSSGTYQYADSQLSGNTTALPSSFTLSSPDTQVATVTVNSNPYVASLTANNVTGNAGGPLVGGTTVTINGSNFNSSDTNTVTIDGQTVPTVSVTTTAIKFVTPSAPAGTYDVTVNDTTAGVSSSTSANDQFTYVSRPTVTSISPSSGNESGLTTITVNGTGFIGGASVNFGVAGAGSSVQILSPTQLTVVNPPAPSSQAYTVDTTVTTPSGSGGASLTSATSSSDRFVYTLETIAQADASSDGTAVTLDANPIVTYILQRPNDPTSAYTTWEFLIDDGSATINLQTGKPTNADSIMVSATQAQLGSYTPTVGDEIKISGTVSYANGSIQLPELRNVTSVTKISSGNAKPADFDPTITANDILNITSGHAPYAGQLVTVANVNLPTAGNAYFGTGGATYGSIIDSTDATSTNPPGLNYYANSFGVAVDNLQGLQVPTTNATFKGIVSYDYNDPIQLLVISVPGNTEHFTYTATSDGTTPLPLDTQSTTTKTDGFSLVNRGNSIVVTVSRTETGNNPYLDTENLNVLLTPDSAVAGTDFSVAGVTPSNNGSLTVPVSFPAYNGEPTGGGSNLTAATTQTFTITTSGSTPGDKLFSISLPTQLGSSSGYNLASITPASTIDIHDTTSGVYSDFASDSSGTYTSELSSIGQNNSQTASTPTVSVEGTNHTPEGYVIQTFNDSAFDPTDVLDQNGNTVEAIDGVEFEATLSGYERGGTLNVYISDSNAYTIGGAGQSTSYPVSSLSFQSSNNGVGGTTNASTSDITGAPNLGDLYLLGKIAWTADSSSNSSTYITGAETPFNLTTLDPTGTSLLADELSDGSPITLVITPGNNSVAATFDGFSTSSNYAAIEPNLRVDYSTSLPSSVSSWVTTQKNSDNSTGAIWIAPTNTLAVTGAATITADPDPSEVNDTVANPTGGGTLPNIFATDALASRTGISSASIAFTPENAQGTPTNLADYFHIAGIDLEDGATATVTSLDGASSTGISASNHSTNHSTLVIGSTVLQADGQTYVSQSTPPTFTIDTTNDSYLDLSDNDMVVHGGNFDTIQALAFDGRNGTTGGALDGTWDGNGLNSSAAAAAAQNPSEGNGNEFTALAVVENGDELTGGFSNWKTDDGSGPGEPLDSNGNDVIVKYTYIGDWALHGEVDPTDSSIFSLQYGTQPGSFFGANNDDAWASGSYNGLAAIGPTDSSVFSLFYGDGTPGSNYPEL